MKKIQKSAARFDNLKQDFLDDKKYSGTADATLNGYRYDITRFLKFLSDEQLAVNEVGFKRYVIHLTDTDRLLEMAAENPNLILIQEDAVYEK